MTNRTTPTVTLSPSPSVASRESDETSEDGRNESAETLDSYRQMNSLVDSMFKTESDSGDEVDKSK